MMLQRIWVVIGWALIFLVIYLSLAHESPSTLTFENLDKIKHLAAYAMLSFWLCQVYPSRRARLLVIVALLALGVALEYVQGWTGYRTFDVLDMQADGVGVLAGWLLVLTPLGRMLAGIERRVGVLYRHPE
jgi:VanZ family protein